MLAKICCVRPVSLFEVINEPIFMIHAMNDVAQVRNAKDDQFFPSQLKFVI